jgi:Zn-dependent M28 family amino/carboxypeptidase
MKEERHSRRHKALLISALMGVALLLVFGWMRYTAEYEMNREDGSSESRHERLRRTILDLQSMGERASWQGQYEASRYVQQRIAELGLKPEVQTYTHEGSTYQNIIAALPGSVELDRRLLAIAHYDSKNWIPGKDAPGADDNASGVAALLEVARILCQGPNHNSMQLVFFSNEEQDQIGSKHFARNAKETGTNIGGIINIDTVGYHFPYAIFSSQPFSVMGSSDFSIMRKVKMIVKMGYNFLASFLFRSKVLMVAGRDEDQQLIPESIQKKEEIGENCVHWVIGDVCP